MHSASLISKTLGSSKRKGTIDSSTAKDLLKPPPTEAAQPQLEIGTRPPLTTLINSYDFEAVAEKVLTKKAWAFYSSAATNLVTRDANRTMFDRIWFRPRLLRSIRHINTSTTILGQNVKLPFFVSPAAMARLAHPDGELALARGCEKYGIAQCVCNSSSSEDLAKHPKNLPQLQAKSYARCSRSGTGLPASNMLTCADFHKCFVHNGRNHFKCTTRVDTVLFPALCQQRSIRFRGST